MGQWRGHTIKLNISFVQFYSILQVVISSTNAKNLVAKLITCCMC